MSVKFAVYESTTLEDLGTVAQVVGKKGTLKFSNKNLASEKLNSNGVRVAVVIVLKQADGKTSVVSCSQSVSVSVRKALEEGMEQKKALAIVSKLSVLEGPSEVPFICAPVGSSLGEEFTIEQLATEKVVDYAELIA